MWRDVRDAVKALRQTPIFTLAVTLALGLAIGANATIVSLIDGLWFRPPGVESPGQIVRIFATTDTDRYGVFSFPEYEDVRDRTSAFSGVAAIGRRGATLDDDAGSPELLLANVVSLDFFTTLGVRPAHGRLFTPADAPLLETQPAVVLSEAFWRRRFGGDPLVVGRTLRLGRGSKVPVVVLGILPPSFRELDAASDRDLWMPPQTWARLVSADEFVNRDERWFEIVARRAASMETAQAQVAGLAAALAQSYPATNAGRGARVVSDLNYRLDVGGVNAAVLLALVLLVVIITCVNVTNLLLARGDARSRELALRVAVGASRWRLVRALLIESAVLGLAGVAAGLVCAMWLIAVLPALQVPPPGLRSFAIFQLDHRVALFTLLVTLVTTLLFGTLPAYAASRTDAAALIKSAPVSPRVRRAGASLPVVAQIAVSLVLLSAAAVLARSFVEATRGELGFTRRPVLSAWVTLGDLPAQVTIAEAVRQLEGLPGVTGVATAIRAPLSLSGGGLATPLAISETPLAAGQSLPSVKFNAVSASYFAVMGMRLLGGRLLSADDEREGPAVMVINQQFAARFFPGEQAIGRVVRVGGLTGTAHRVIGVVQNTPINEIGEPPEPYFYTPYARGRRGEVTFLIATAADPALLAATVRDTLTRIDGGLEPRRLIAMSQYIEYSGSRYRATAALAAALGFVGLLLTTLGVYGVMGSRTARRTKEIGIRVALGATRADVLRMVLRDGVWMAGAGLAIGLPAAVATTTAMRSLLLGVAPGDAASLSAAAAALLLPLAVAALVPAWRAARIDPSTALRDAT